MIGNFLTKIMIKKNHVTEPFNYRYWTEPPLLNFWVGFTPETENFSG